MTELPQTDELREKLAQFLDDYIDEWTAKGNKLDKLHQLQDDFVASIQADRTEHRTRASELTELKIRAHEIGLQPASPYGRRRLDELTKKINALSKQEEQK